MIKSADYELGTICIIAFDELKQAFEKVGETALIVLSEKMKPKTGLNSRSTAIVVRQDIETKWKKGVVSRSQIHVLLLPFPLVLQARHWTQAVLQGCLQGRLGQMHPRSRWKLQDSSYLCHEELHPGPLYGQYGTGRDNLRCFGFRYC